MCVWVLFRSGCRQTGGGERGGAMRRSSRTVTVIDCNAGRQTARRIQTAGDKSISPLLKITLSSFEPPPQNLHIHFHPATATATSPPPLTATPALHPPAPPTPDTALRQLRDGGILACQPNKAIWPVPPTFGLKSVPY